MFRTLENRGFKIKLFNTYINRIIKTFPAPLFDIDIRTLKTSLEEVKEQRFNEFERLLKDFPFLYNIAMSYCTKCGVCCIRTNCEAISVEKINGVYSIRCKIYNRDQLDAPQDLLPPINETQIKLGYKRPEICKTFTPAHEFLALQLLETAGIQNTAGDCYFKIRDKLEIATPIPTNISDKSHFIQKISEKKNFMSYLDN